MAIPVSCECGKRLNARDDMAGRKAKCPDCGEFIAIPVPSAKEAVNVQAPGEIAYRPFWKDPIVVIGAAVPAVILAVFFAYLGVARSARQFREHIHAEKAEADRLARDGKGRNAYERYQALLDYVGWRDPGDSQAREEVASARAAAARLKTVALAEKAREQKEQRRMVAEAEAARRKAEEDEAYRRLELAGKQNSEALRQALDRIAADRSAENVANLKLVSAAFDDIQARLNDRYRPLLLEAAKYFKTEVEEIGMDARSTCEQLREAGIQVDVESFIRGGIYLSKNTHYPERESGLPTFRSYAYLYDDLRRRTKMSHQETIDDLYNRQKF